MHVSHTRHRSPSRAAANIIIYKSETKKSVNPRFRDMLTKRRTHSHTHEIFIIICTQGARTHASNYNIFNISHPHNISQTYCAHDCAHAAAAAASCACNKRARAHSRTPTHTQTIFRCVCHALHAAHTACHKRHMMKTVCSRENARAHLFRTRQQHHAYQMCVCVWEGVVEFRWRAFRDRFDLKNAHKKTPASKYYPG